MLVILQSTATNVTAFLSSSTGAVTGLTSTDLTVSLKKEGASVFTPKVLAPTDIVEIGSGFYDIVLDTSDTDTLGNMYISVSGSLIDTTLLTGYVSLAASTPTPSTTLPINVSTLFGYLYDLQGNPVSSGSVVIKVLSSPVLVFSGNDIVALKNSVVSTKTDDSGYFSVDIATGVTVEVSIASASFRKSLLVTSGSVSVFE